ncbi:MAG: DUF3102 domain-containing protein [Spirochaetia bacterium]|jgi:hypothetical protein
MSGLEVSRSAEIRRLHEEIGGALRLSVGKAIRIGELLAEQKAIIAHGSWLLWIEANCPFDERTARRYMRLHARREELKSDSVSDLTSAYRLLEAPEDEAGEDDRYAVLWRRQELEIPGSSMTVVWDGPDVKARAKDDPHVVIEEYKKLLGVFSAVVRAGNDLGLLVELQKVVFAFAQATGETSIDIEAKIGELLPKGGGKAG